MHIKVSVVLNKQNRLISKSIIQIEVVLEYQNSDRQFFIRLFGIFVFICVDVVAPFFFNIFGFLLCNLPNGTLVGWVHLFVEWTTEIGSELGHVCKRTADTELRRRMHTS